MERRQGQNVCFPQFPNRASMGIGDVSAWVKRLTRLSSQLGLDGPGGFETDDQIKEVYVHELERETEATG
jgi:hypothetical protein